MEPVTLDSAVNATQAGNAWGMIIYCVVLIAIIYLLIVRPGKRRLAEFKKMLDSLKMGDRVVAAGIYGTIKKINETTIDVEVAKGVVIEVSKNAIVKVEK